MDEGNLPEGVSESDAQSVIERTFERARADKSVGGVGSVTLAGLKSACSSQLSTVDQIRQQVTS